VTPASFAAAPWHLGSDRAVVTATETWDYDHMDDFFAALPQADTFDLWINTDGGQVLKLLCLILNNMSDYDG
jgi:hypothetical protein